MNKAILILFLWFILLGKVQGQSINELPKNSMQVLFGYSFHGTDNVGGIAYSVEYSHYFHKKLCYSAFMGTTLHDGLVPVVYFDNKGNVVDGKVNYTTAGLQAGIALGYSFYRNKRHHLQGSLGSLLRYQSTSNPEIIGFSIPFPFPEYVNFPARILSIGGIAAFSYDYTFANSVFLAVKGWLQYDSNDDALNMFSIGFGRRF